MIKKLGDLTITELKAIEEEQCKKYKSCLDCPFNQVCITGIDLNQEIEVEDNAES